VTVLVLLVVAWLFVWAVMTKSLLMKAALWVLIFGLFFAASHHVLGL
jgi:hypothetical protein